MMLTCYFQRHNPAKLTAIKAIMDKLGANGTNGARRFAKGPAWNEINDSTLRKYGEKLAPELTRTQGLHGVKFDSFGGDLFKWREVSADDVSISFGGAPLEKDVTLRSIGVESGAALFATLADDRIPTIEQQTRNYEALVEAVREEEAQHAARVARLRREEEARQAAYAAMRRAEYEY